MRTPRSRSHFPSPAGERVAEGPGEGEKFPSTSRVRKPRFFRISLAPAGERVAAGRVRGRILPRPPGRGGRRPGEGGEFSLARRVEGGRGPGDGMPAAVFREERRDLVRDSPCTQTPEGSLEPSDRRPAVREVARSNGGLESVQVHRLGQVIDEPGLAALTKVLFGAEAAHGDAQHLPAGAELAHQVEPVAIGQLDIRKQEVERDLGLVHRGAGGGDAVGGHDIVAALAENAREEPASILVVFDQQDAQVGPGRVQQWRGRQVST